MITTFIVILDVIVIFILLTLLSRISRDKDIYNNLIPYTRLASKLRKDIRGFSITLKLCLLLIVAVNLIYLLSAFSF